MPGLYLNPHRWEPPRPTPRQAPDPDWNTRRTRFMARTFWWVWLFECLLQLVVASDTHAPLWSVLLGVFWIQVCWAGHRHYRRQL